MSVPREVWLAQRRSYVLRDRQKFPEKNEARWKAAYAIKKGRLKRGPCEVCGNMKSEAHHDDYAQPLNVRWLCHFHHLAMHRAQYRAERRRLMPERETA